MPPFLPLSSTSSYHLLLHLLPFFRLSFIIIILSHGLFINPSSFYLYKRDASSGNGTQDLLDQSLLWSLYPKAGSVLS